MFATCADAYSSSGSSGSSPRSMLSNIAPPCTSAGLRPRVLGAPTDHVAHDLLDEAQAEGLLDAAVVDRGEELGRSGGERAARHEDDAPLDARPLGAEHVVELDAAHLGHHEIAEDDV